MAEGSVEEDSSEMLGPTIAPVLQTPAPSNCSLKDEESDCESSIGSPEPALAMGIDGSTDLSMGPKPTHTRMEDTNIGESKMSPTAHLNGTMAGLVTLQNLQNLATLQQSLPQVASLAAGLTNMAGLTGNPPINAPLNLSVSASAATPRSSQSSSVSDMSPVIMTPNVNTPQPPQSTPLPTQNPLINAQQPAPMPQFILASGQLVQGIQGAQLLIPTSQGLATQTILTIPVNHVNSSDQMVNLALNNGQVMQTSLANLQAMAQTNLINNAGSTVPTTNGTINPNLLNPATLSHLLSNGSTQSLLQTLPPNPPILNPMQQPLLTQAPTLLTTTQQHNSRSPMNHLPQISNNTHYQDTKMHQPIIRNNSPPASASSVTRMPSNGEISINTSMGGNSSQNVSQVKRSPSSLSPNCTDNSTADLLIDSPNQPTINQTSSNVVDGINLDEIKDFAKAFKLRRLSLGLTQTQVGQALSVTEGPAYSQSAICSALASQMFAAAQLSSQQQAMFEKLDITPKSAQKIKPVLERWMKEAEERYKSGQNHLTDFIGIEPSKKRKRRTSFTPQALELLNAHFERNTHPSGTEITGLAHQLGYEREVIRIWFCNKRQALKNTVRMMSKSMV
ncbi:POU domain, class 6, transcription factor 2 isoform X2 [Aethina tumida]|uniref:POU domain, class 6, transcription factor 2 isoform X2 n=1 Tax=Aethina tumida TaxID=116153 RepID=UPI002147DD9D|nr:POU domain, class 6, transcription factor 2 isoform X2 [Aethina tumida]